MISLTLTKENANQPRLKQIDLKNKLTSNICIYEKISVAIIQYLHSCQGCLDWSIPHLGQTNTSQLSKCI